jgi:hypothetical protein
MNVPLNLCYPANYYQNFVGIPQTLTPINYQLTLGGFYFLLTEARSASRMMVSLSMPLVPTAST